MPAHRRALHRPPAPRRPRSRPAADAGHPLRRRSSRAVRTAGLATAATAAAALVLAGAGAAQADRTRVESSGRTTLQLGGPALAALSGNGCGALTATALGDAQVKTTGAGKLQAKFAVTSLVYTDTEALRVAHADSGVELSNSCYDVRFSGLLVDGLGPTRHTAHLDVLAKTRSADESGARQLLFQLDATTTRYVAVLRGNTVTLKAFSFDLRLGDEGAAEFNQLATGSETSGPFTAGQVLGKARLSLHLPRSVVEPHTDDPVGTTTDPAPPAPQSSDPQAVDSPSAQPTEG